MANIEKLNENMIEFENAILGFKDGFSNFYYDNDTFGSEYGFLDLWIERAENIISLADNIKDNYTEYEIRLSIDEDN